MKQMDFQPQGTCSKLIHIENLLMTIVFLMYHLLEGAREI